MNKVKTIIENVGMWNRDPAIWSSMQSLLKNIQSFDKWSFEVGVQISNKSTQPFHGMT